MTWQLFLFYWVSGYSLYLSFLYGIEKYSSVTVNVYSKRWVWVEQFFVWPVGFVLFGTYLLVNWEKITWGKDQ